MCLHLSAALCDEERKVINKTNIECENIVMPRCSDVITNNPCEAIELKNKHHSLIKSSKYDFLSQDVVEYRSMRCRDEWAIELETHVQYLIKSDKLYFLFKYSNYYYLFYEFRYHQGISYLFSKSRIINTVKGSTNLSLTTIHDIIKRNHLDSVKICANTITLLIFKRV